MATPLRIATFNLENLDDKPGERPSLSERIAILRPQLLRLRADVICFQEVHGQEFEGEPRQLDALRQLLSETPYEWFYTAHTKTTRDEAYDVRNLVVISRYPIRDVQQIKHEYAPKPSYRKVTATPPEAEAKDITWERPILYVKIDLDAGRMLHLINVHLKSKRPSNVEGQKQSTYVWRTMAGWAEGSFISSMKRVGQALELRVLIDDIFDQLDVSGEPKYIVACGDFNADVNEVPLQAIMGPVEETGNTGLIERVMIPCEKSVPESSRFSLLHLGKKEMLDHILASRQLLTYYRGTEIHNEVLHDESGAFRTDDKFPESDHAPLVAEFVLP
ncbi:MAG: endonuclease/exonuclease/phosphatase family protein [Ardenticatenaceae bacterium]|nr:endonuclease/exonuclease/phosphatase family protein [Anaerolineales bacterium]MCB8937607.1 endonuclease/exonuclease/phosphatase family protein [Ardenticatenaceae bacterium]MCB8974176.1 endonuclease/exonuclease/phosphatase family protein [Ardenticatenaceae bacterium]